MFYLFADDHYIFKVRMGIVSRRRKSLLYKLEISLPSPVDNSRKVSKLASRINANNSRLLVSWSVCLAYASLLTDTFLPGWKFSKTSVAAEMVGKSIRKSNRATRYLRTGEVAATRPPILRFDAPYWHLNTK